MDQEIIAGLKKRIAAAGLDAIIAISPENVTYVSGFVVPSQSLMRWAIWNPTRSGCLAQRTTPTKWPMSAESAIASPPPATTPPSGV